MTAKDETQARNLTFGEELPSEAESLWLLEQMHDLHSRTKKHVDGLRSGMARLEAENLRLQQTVADQRQQMAALQQTVADQQLQMAAQQQQTARLERMVAQLKQQVDKLEHDNETTVQLCALLQRQIEYWQQQMEYWQQQVAQLMKMDQEKGQLLENFAHRQQPPATPAATAPVNVILQAPLNINQCNLESGIQQTLGHIGNIGNTGHIGHIGDAGNAGSIGNAGKTGDTGNTGNAGDTGNIGNIGNL